MSRKKPISQICHECEDLYHQLIKHDDGPFIQTNCTEKEQAKRAAKEHLENAWHLLKDNFRIKRR